MNYYQLIGSVLAGAGVFSISGYYHKALFISMLLGAMTGLGFYLLTL